MIAYLEIFFTKSDSLSTVNKGYIFVQAMYSMFAKTETLWVRITKMLI